MFCLTGLDSDESYEGVSEASFKDALVFDSSSQKKNGSVPQENGIKKHRYCCIPCTAFVACEFVHLQLHYILSRNYLTPPIETSIMCWAGWKFSLISFKCFFWW